ncbi:MAG TPA: RNA methyltransferase [Solirubrobacteraceae bacterium]|nr:RNA methyltransferase [Solirubrobacteraceae bacterium]
MITSPHNDKLKEIRRLQRRREARFVAEGEDLIAAADAAGWPAVYRLRAGIDIAPELLDEVSGLGSGTRELAVYDRRWAQPTGPLCVALWGVRDPGNVGTVLRAALAFGASSVALGPDSADPFAPKAVRASMGAIFAMPVARVTRPDELPGTKIALAARAGAPLGGPIDEPATILVGAERAGLPDAVVAASDRVAHIPIATESLNAAMAATVALYEATRGRPPGGAAAARATDAAAAAPAGEPAAATAAARGGAEAARRPQTATVPPA